MGSAPYPAVQNAVEARLAGVSVYYTGKPCQAGHKDFRLTETGECVSCFLEDVAALRDELDELGDLLPELDGPDWIHDMAMASIVEVDPSVEGGVGREPEDRDPVREEAAAPSSEAGAAGREAPLPSPPAPEPRVCASTCNRPAEEGFKTCRGHRWLEEML